MKLNSIPPMITVRNVSETLDFYKERFEFKAHYNPNANWGYAFRDGVEIMFSAPTIHLPFNQTVFTGSLYINTDDADFWWNKLKDQIEIVYQLETFDYGMREFAVKDLNGIVIQFGQEI